MPGVPGDAGGAGTDAAHRQRRGFIHGYFIRRTGRARYWRRDGLGRSYALDLARRGAKVVVNDLGGDPHGVGENASAAQKVVDEIKAAGGEAVPNYNSVADYDGGYNMVKTAIDTWGRLDVVICNAGILRDVAFHNMSEDDWDKVFAVHIKGSFTVLRAAWPVFRQQSYGRVVVTSSSSGI